ncbi:MAG: glutathione S-transferase N-terminal domain-containing protein [Bryobacterales bacterium]|nr:glutathione S-transferase N-terminal domain-containing protein [Bryobacterales bacterium]
MRVRMYSTSWCSDCWRAKSFLREHGIKFDEVDIERDDEAAQLVIRQNDGRRTVPTFDIDGEYYGNPRIPVLAQILGVPT